MRLLIRKLVLFTVLLAFATPFARAAEESGGEESEARKLTEKYWAEKEVIETKLVQDRYVSKRGKFELAMAGGSLLGSPFLTTYTYGGSFGFHLTEIWSVHAIGWNAPTSRSRSIEILEKDTGTTAGTNSPKYYLGGEMRASVADGKITLADTYILYFEFRLSAGAGGLATDSGTDLALSAGIGQSVYLSRNFAANVDFKLLRYRDTRTNLSCLVTLGLSTLF